jgi:hypothetical protein
MTVRPVGCTFRRAAAVAAGGVALAAAADVATYPLWRTWCLHWGATDDEASRTMPGDDLLPNPDLLTTRVVTVAAPPSAIWPWLVQMGPGRGGAYTYDWIENLLGLGMHSANEILPQYQDLRVGDAQRLGGSGPTLRVSVLEAERCMALRSDDGNWVWAFELLPAAGTGTRLVSRNRIATPGATRPARALYTYLMEPGSLIMERKMLLGIKARAERLSQSPPEPSALKQRVVTSS